MKQAIVCSAVGKQRDRFCEYGEDAPIAEKLARIARIPGVDGVELVYPRDLQALDEVKNALAQLKLAVSAVNVNVKSDREFIAGGLTSPDPAVRRKAVDYIKRGKECAVALGASRITCCPLADGYDYPFQACYGAMWERMVETIGEAAQYLPEINLSLEYKPCETRVHNLLSSAAKTVLLCQAVGGKGVGVTVDTGHSTLGGESPAESLMQVVSSGLPFYVHVNDTNGKWDWDLMAGACNVWEYLEFLFYVKEAGYDDWVTCDAVAFRQDPVELYALNAHFTAQLWRWLDTVDRSEIREHLRQNDFIWVRKLMEPHLFAPGTPAFSIAQTKRTA
jgi:xylose isomerase